MLQSLVLSSFLALNVSDTSLQREKRLYKALRTKIKKFQRKRGKLTRTKDKNKMTCYNCGKKGHFTCESTKPKKVLSHFTLSYKTYVSSTTLLTKSHPMWTVNSGAIDHAT